MKLILGIDPGLSGGMVWLNMDGTIYRARNMQDLENVATQLRVIETDHAYIELVHSRPRQAGQFKFGFNTGAIHGVLAALQIPTTTVTPQAWKAAYGIKRSADETKADKKNEARAIAMKLFPTHADSFKRVKDDGVAEAALIALYGLSLWKQS